MELRYDNRKTGEKAILANTKFLVQSACEGRKKNREDFNSRPREKKTSEQAKKQPA
jgi:hypothetical protein